MYIPGDHYVICDRCSFRRRRSDVRKEWTGLIVCKDTCWEKKHPQLEIKAVRDNQSVKDARPEPTDTFISTDAPITVDDL